MGQPHPDNEQHRIRCPTRYVDEAHEALHKYLVHVNRERDTHEQGILMEGPADTVWQVRCTPNGTVTVTLYKLEEITADDETVGTYFQDD